MRILLTGCVFIAACCVAGRLSAELVHHWTLDDDIAGGATMALDTGSRGLDGQIGGSVATVPVPERGGNAFMFTGDGQSQVLLPGFSTTGLEQLTASVWVKTTDDFTLTGGFKRLVSAVDEFELIMNANTGLFGNNFYRAGGTYAVSTEPPPNDEWVFVTMTADFSTGQQEIYIDGVFDAELGGATDPWPGGTLGFGVRGSNLGGSRFVGLLDDIRFYDTVFNEQEVLALFESYQFGSSDMLFTWGNRTASGSWSSTTGWQKDGVNTTEIPNIGANDADPVQILSGTVRVDTGDQGAWSLQIDGGASVEVASGFTLEILNDGVTMASGSSLSLGGTLHTPTIDSQGTVTFSGGVLSAGEGTIAAVATSSNATIENSGELTIEQATLGAGDTLLKESAGALILDQSGGGNSIADGSAIDIQGGSVVAVNDATNNALGSADVNVDGGDLVLSSRESGATAFDVPVAVTSHNAIRAAQIGSGALAGETVTLGGTNGVTVAVGGEATLETLDGYTLNLAGDVTGGGQLSFGSGAQVQVTGSVSTTVVEFQGDSGNVQVVTNLSPGQAYSFAPTADTPEMQVGFAIGGAVDVIVDGQVDGSVQLNGPTTYTGVTRIRRGTFVTSAGAELAGDYNGDGTVGAADYTVWRNGNSPDSSQAGYDLWKQNFGAAAASGSAGLPAGGLLQFEGATAGTLAVLESADAMFERNIGTGAGEVNWAGAGGFASRGGENGLTVALNGGANLNYAAAFNGNTLQLGSPFADGKVTFTNNLDVGTEANVQIADNPNTLDDSVEIAGVVSGGTLIISAAAGGGTFGGGLLTLSANNSFSKLLIEDASVDAALGTGLPLNASLEFNGNSDNRPSVWAGSGNFNRNIGLGAGQVTWTGVGGFAAHGGDLTVSLEGGAELVWQSADAGFNGQDFQLGSNQSDGVTIFTNDVVGWNDGAGGSDPGNRNFETFGNPLSSTDEIRIEGDFIEGFNNFFVDGFDSRVVFTGDITAGNNLQSRDGPFVLQLEGVVNVQNNAQPTAQSSMFVNNIMTVATGNVDTEGSGTLGGDGTINVFQAFVSIDGGGSLQPGPGPDEVGTLSVELESGSVFRLNNNSTYEMEFADDGGNVVNDVVNVTGGAPVGEIRLGQNAGNQWNLELSALGNLSGLGIDPSDEFDLIVWDDANDLVINGQNISLDVGPGTDEVLNVVLSSTDFNISGASVNYEIAGNFSGRVYVTGLSLAGAAAAVPEPASLALALLGAMLAAGRLRT